MDYDNPCNPHCDASPKALILSDIWFADGNIILIANSATFKVHHGQLERHLEVFRDLFSVPQPIDQNLVDGCPSVELHDRLSDLYHLLIALYDGIYFTKHTSADFVAIAAVLRLSTKYFIEHLRERCIARLAIDWPTSLPQWDRRENDGIDHGGRYNPRETLPHPILMLKLACELFTAFPSLLRLPSWLPGMHVKRVAPLAKKLVLDILETPFARMATGTVSSSMVSDHLRALDESDSDSAWQKKAVKESAATAFGAGTETTASVLMNFILAMILHTHAQERAYNLIESVVGAKRLPTFQDRPSLSYVDAILHECMRWRPVFPFAIMHATVESDVYKGYYIPKVLRSPRMFGRCATTKRNTEMRLNLILTAS